MNKNKKITIIVVVIVAIVLIGYVVLRNQQKNNEINIGVVLPLSGGAASFYGEYGQRGLMLALEDLNKDFNQKKISVTIEDSQDQPKLGINAVNKLINQGIHFVIGGQISGVTLAMAPIVEQNKVLLIVPGSASPKVTDAGDYIFRTKVSAAIEAKKVSDFIVNELSIRKVAFLYQNSDYGVGVFNVLKAEMEKGGVIMTNDEHFEIGSVDMRTQLTKIKSSDAELVLLAGYPKDIGQILRQASELKLDKKFFAHSGSIGPDVVKVGGTGAENLLFLYEISVNKEDQKTKSFFDRYEQKYSDSPELFSMIAYDTTVLLGEKIRECKEDVECVKNALYNTVNYPGITGLINFDNKGDIIRDLFTLFTIKEGKFVITE